MTLNGSPLNDPKDGNFPSISSFGGDPNELIRQNLFIFPVLFCFSEISEVRVLEIHPTDWGSWDHAWKGKVMDSCKNSCQRGTPFALNANDMHMICTWWRPWRLNFVPLAGVLESLPCENPFIGVISDKFLHELRKLGVGMRNEPLNACALAMQTMNTGF